MKNSGEAEQGAGGAIAPQKVSRIYVQLAKI